jgi:transcriptional regulator with XRE-family HTH domain
MGSAMDWPHALKEYRRRHGLTQAAFAERLNVDNTTVSRWERGRDQPSLSVQKTLRQMVLPAMPILGRALADMIDTTGDIAVLMDRNYRLLRASRAHQSMLRYSGSDMYGTQFPFWTDAMFQIIGHAGGPEGWWENGIYRMDFHSLRKPGERAGNTAPLYQSVTTFTLVDTSGEPLRFSITKRIKANAYRPGPPTLAAY